MTKETPMEETNKLPNKEEETCPHGAKDGECVVEGCANEETIEKDITFSPSDKTWEDLRWKVMDMLHNFQKELHEKDHEPLIRRSIKGVWADEIIKLVSTSATIKAKKEVLREAVKIIREYSLQDWSGEAEVYEEIENIAKRVEGINLKEPNR